MIRLARSWDVYSPDTEDKHISQHYQHLTEFDRGVIVGLYEAWWLYCAICLACEGTQMSLWPDSGTNGHARAHIHVTTFLVAGDRPHQGRIAILCAKRYRTSWDLRLPSGHRYWTLRHWFCITADDRHVCVGRCRVERTTDGWPQKDLNITQAVHRHMCYLHPVEVLLCPAWSNMCGIICKCHSAGYQGPVTTAHLTSLLFCCTFNKDSTLSGIIFSSVCNIP